MLILWLNKVAEAVYAKRADEINGLLQDPDPKQRKKNKSVVVKSGGYPAIPLIVGDICTGISDGQSLAALMLHYAPQACNWNGKYKVDPPPSIDRVRNTVGVANLSHVEVVPSL